MPARENLFGVVSASASEVTLRVLRDCTSLELLASLPVSKATRRRFAAQGIPEHMAAGDVVALQLEERRALGPVDKRPVRILWSDRFALVADKPTGLLVHGDGTGASTLTARVQAHVCRHASEQGWPFAPVAQAVNRLDVETSGLVLFSQMQEFQPAFDEMMAGRQGQLRKHYLAIVEGEFAEGPLTISAPIARNRHDARRMRVGPTGKPAQTRVVCLERAGGCSLLACELHTGRRHQIRVHLQHKGHAILGDALYGRPHEAGLMLHAYHMDFCHPVTGERVMLATDWPQRFTSLFPPRPIDWSILDSE